MHNVQSAITSKGRITPIPQGSFHYPRKGLLLHCKVPIYIYHSTIQGCKKHVLYTTSSHHFLWMFYLFPSLFNDTMSAEGLSFPSLFYVTSTPFDYEPNQQKIIGISKWDQSLWSILMALHNNHPCNTGPSEVLFFLLHRFHRNVFSTPEGFYLFIFSFTFPMPLADIAPPSAGTFEGFILFLHPFNADYHQPWGGRVYLSVQFMTSRIESSQSLNRRLYDWHRPDTRYCCKSSDLWQFFVTSSCIMKGSVSFLS